MSLQPRPFAPLNPIRVLAATRAVICDGGIA